MRLSGLGVAVESVSNRFSPFADSPLSPLSSLSSCAFPARRTHLPVAVLELGGLRAQLHAVDVGVGCLGDGLLQRHHAHGVVALAPPVQREMSEQVANA